MKRTDLDYLRVAVNMLESALYARNHRWTADQKNQLRRARNILAKENGKDEEPQGSGERGSHDALLDKTE